MTDNRTIPKYRTIRIPQDNLQLGKADEIALLKKIAEAVPAHSYLASLFSPELVDHFEYHARSDFNCNVMDELEVMKDGRQHSQQQAAEAQQTAHMLEDAHNTAAEYKRRCEASAEINALIRTDLKTAEEAADSYSVRMEAFQMETRRLSCLLEKANAKMATFKSQLIGYLMCTERTAKATKGISPSTSSWMDGFVTALRVITSQLPDSLRFTGVAAPHDVFTPFDESTLAQIQAMPEDDLFNDC